MARALVCLLVLVAALPAQWPQFRGPAGSGIGAASTLPTDIGPDKYVAWKAELPAGHSSPVIADDRIFITGATGGERADAPNKKVVDRGGRLYTISLDRRTGKILWQREAPRPRVEQYQPTNSPASPSPVTDGKHVYAFFGDFGLLAYDMDGKEVWRHPLGPFNNANGHGSSPILHQDLLILVCDQDTNSFVIAVDKLTGRERWRAPRPEVTRAYATPVVVRNELVVPGAYTLTGYDVKTGKKLWWIGGLSWQPKSTPVADGDIVYAHWWENGGEAESPTETPEFAEILKQFDKDSDRKLTREEVAADVRMSRGFIDNDLGGDGAIDERDWEFYRARRASRNALLAVRTGGRGDLTKSPNILWRMQKFLPNSPSPLLHQGILYLIKDGGILTAVDAKTGEVRKQGRLTGALDTYYASPVAAGNHIYFLSQSGKLTVVKAGAEWEIVSSADFGEDTFSTPAIDETAMYLRTKTALYCFRAAQP